ncbi:DEAD/DEAH box helicase [Rhodovulum sulfidophilum]|uniref:DEAD/DEAH box helicase n=1 Tax=Rhodovulum sulfidophilum TaxID=35806 RepID=UPI000951F953|nr:DEAD/DEAH box helicase family protein [Rhodovulum sulfidophilum]MBL3554456.1 DEAD/DEAH box helicase family protein [Rhodovulum sulfidophilum]OLS46922.1 DEAD/DEAH box helicase [Rhodovulum sulfidophilum]
MVDFKKRLNKKNSSKPTDPIKLYDSLDRASDKGPLRPAQETVLTDWASRSAQRRDVIVKLHTGQGKTLVGLLMLQSRLNAKAGPAVYLCPDHFLIAQTCEQAEQFGISTCTAENSLPDTFLDGKAILVTSVQKLFNGLTQFGIGNRSVDVGTILLDDAHACADRIRESCAIKIPKGEEAYSSLKTLFSSDLEQQGVGTFADVENGKREAILPVPYWAWTERESEVATILSKCSDRKSVKFAWPLLKDMLSHCQCVFSGASVEIEPRLAPLDMFGSFAKAGHRIFMSATVTDDAFLIKGLKLTPKTITTPLTDASETWSGEKMVIIPSLIHENLDSHAIQKALGKPRDGAKFGMVALVPSFARAEPWVAQGAALADKKSIEEAISGLISGDRDETVVLANRYDGIDLPDASCRILIFDSRPYSENLADLLAEQVRPHSETTLMRTVRTVEQGLGRSVRGEKDYSVIVLTGSDLVRLVRESGSRKFLSPQVAKQIEIGLEVSELAREDVLDNGETPTEAFKTLVNQCLRRDEDWKAFYAEQMDGIKPKGANDALLELYAGELKAETLFVGGDYQGASKHLQKIMDSGLVNSDDKAWFLQERARYHYEADRGESQKLQLAAHRKNRMLLKPASGVTVTQLHIVSHGRAERIIAWLSSFADYDELNVAVTDILGRLRFGVKAEPFEAALNELATALGFAGERPDREWKEGPDNLWALDDRSYLVIEAKSEVDVTRAEINKGETEQMNKSAAWFDKHYKGMLATRVIIHPAKKIGSAAAFTHDVQGIVEHDLRKLEKACRVFFKSFEGQDLKSLSSGNIQTLIDAHRLSVSDIQTGYSRKLRDIRRS